MKRLVLMVAALISLFVGPLQAAPLEIQPGFDFFLSEPGTFFTVPALPAGFFGQKNGTQSDPTAQQVINGVGNPPISGIIAPPTTFVPDPTCHVGPGQAHADCVRVPVTISLNSVSTVVQRGETTLTNIGDSGTVDLKIVELHLENVPEDPFVATYGSQPSSFFDVFANLNPAVPQQNGSLFLTRTGDTFGTMVTNLPVDFRLTFIERGGPLSATLTGSTVLGGTSTFNVIPEPTTLLLLGSGLAGIAGYGRFRHSKRA